MDFGPRDCDHSNTIFKYGKPVWRRIMIIPFNLTHNNIQNINKLNRGIKAQVNTDKKTNYFEKKRKNRPTRVQTQNNHNNLHYRKNLKKAKFNRGKNSGR